MTDTSGFDLQNAPVIARLEPDHGKEFRRLLKVLRYGPPFQFCLLDCRDQVYRDRLMTDLDGLLPGYGLSSTRVHLDPERFPDFLAVALELRGLSAQHRAIHITGGPLWFDDSRLSSANLNREALAREVRCALLLWANPELIARLATVAPDLWSWRSGVFDFSTQVKTPVPTEIPQWRSVIDPRPLPERARRIAELRSWLKEPGGMDDEIRVVLLDELAGLLEDMGEYDEALRIRREQELPLYERLGNVRSKAVTQSKIADIFFARGQLDEALHIRQHEELPVYERLGDMRAKAVTQGQIADIFFARGQLDEALHIRQYEELPVYERLGDVREKAITQGKIADILEARGQFDEALHIRQHEELPVYERLGDVRLKAVTQGKIADILCARGELDAALHIREQEVLPVFERLGSVRDLLICRWWIAHILLQRAHPQDRLRAEALLRQARATALSMRIPEAEQIAETMRKHGFDPDASP